MNRPTNDEIVTFYDVPLMCDAAPAIGCGSLAKPSLIDLERQAAIEEAWINRAGTIVAIVWSGVPRNVEVAKPIFERHDVGCQERPGHLPASFREDGSWFRGPDVDLLSLEEAREIAEISVPTAKRERLISVEEAARIESDIEAYFREELVKLRTKRELLRDVDSKFRRAAPVFFEKHIGMERTADVVRAGGIQDAFYRVDRDEALSCCA